jgi:hypothetical protein
MSIPEWWDSPERIAVWLSRFSTTATLSSALAVLGWASRLFLLAIPATVLALASILMTVFIWFRKDDLASRGAPPKR